MSGTSLDGVDVALVTLAENDIQIIGSHFYPYSDTLRSKIKTLQTKHIPSLNTELGVLYADCINTSLKKLNLTASKIRGIGLHGQTIDHQPHAIFPYSLQVGDPNFVCFKTGITTVADFRTRDICAGGEGAPLVPAFHEKIFRHQNKNIMVLNLGGISNITYLPADKDIAVVGFDTGPANCLSDDWIENILGQKYDKGGAWAKSGTVSQNLLTALLQDTFFQTAPPKSTGREHFNLRWLNTFHLDKLKPEDIQATLLELTVQSITKAIKTYPTDEVLVCGGGIHNLQLITRLKEQLKPLNIQSTTSKGLDPDTVEAVAFAWLAKQTLNHKTGNLPSVTGASKKVVLGAIYTA